MYAEVQTAVEKYFREQLSKGITVNQVIQDLKTGSLPWELRNLRDVPLHEIRRVGQHVSTRYIIEQNQEQSAVMDLN